MNDSQKMFELAIERNILSLDKSSTLYVGHYMYMGAAVKPGHVVFKHSNSRESILMEL